MLQIGTGNIKATPMPTSAGKVHQRIAPVLENYDSKRIDYDHAVHLFAKITTSPENMGRWKKFYTGLKGLFSKTVWIQVGNTNYCKVSQSSLIKRYGEEILTKKNAQGFISKADLSSTLQVFYREQKQLFECLSAFEKNISEEDTLEKLNELVDFIETIKDPVLKYKLSLVDHWSKNKTGDEPEIPTQAFLQLKQRYEDGESDLLPEIHSHARLVGWSLQRAYNPTVREDAEAKLIPLEYDPSPNTGVDESEEEPIDRASKLDNLLYSYEYNPSPEYQEQYNALNELTYRFKKFESLIRFIELDGGQKLEKLYSQEELSRGLRDNEMRFFVIFTPSQVPTVKIVTKSEIFTGTIHDNAIFFDDLTHRIPLGNDTFTQLINTFEEQLEQNDLRFVGFRKVETT